MHTYMHRVWAQRASPSLAQRASRWSCPSDQRIASGFPSKSKAFHPNRSLDDYMNSSLRVSALFSINLWTTVLMVSRVNLMIYWPVSWWSSVLVAGPVSWWPHAMVVRIMVAPCLVLVNVCVLVDLCFVTPCHGGPVSWWPLVMVVPCHGGPMSWLPCIMVFPCLGGPISWWSHVMVAPCLVAPCLGFLVSWWPHVVIVPCCMAPCLGPCNSSIVGFTSNPCGSKGIWEPVQNNPLYDAVFSNGLWFDVLLCFELYYIYMHINTWNITFFWEPHYRQVIASC